MEATWKNTESRPYGRGLAIKQLQQCFILQWFIYELSELILLLVERPSRCRTSSAAKLIWQHGGCIRYGRARPGGRALRINQCFQSIFKIISNIFILKYDWKSYTNSKFDSDNISVTEDAHLVNRGILCGGGLLIGYVGPSKSSIHSPQHDRAPWGGVLLDL